MAPHQDTPPKETDEHHDENNSNQNPFHRFGKIGCLVAVWCLMVMFLTSTPEKVLERRQLAVPIAEPRIYNFTKLPSTGTRINATFAGAFLPSESTVDHQQKKYDYITRKSKMEKEKENYIRVYLRSDKSDKALTLPKLFAVVEPKYFDTTNTTKIPIMFDIGEDNFEELEESDAILQLVIESNFTKTPEDQKQEMPLQFVYDIAPINKQLGVIFAAFTLIFLYALIIWEVSIALDQPLQLKYLLRIVKEYYSFIRHAIFFIVSVTLLFADCTPNFCRHDCQYFVDCFTCSIKRPSHTSRDYRVD